MIEIIHVDQGDVLFKFSNEMPFNEVIELIVDRLHIASSLILLYNSEGFIIDPSIMPRLSDNTQLFLFRRDFVNKDSSVPKLF